MSHISYVNGRYLPHAAASVHIEDRGYQFADGVYEVICYWNGKPIDYKGHMQRLERSLAELQIRQPCTMRALTVIVREVVARNRLTTGHIYMQINRGVANRAHYFPKPSVKPSVVVVTKPVAGPSDAVAEKGGKVVTTPDIRWERVDIKSVSLLPNCLAKQLAQEAKAFETFLHLPDGTVTEASASNAWMVTPDQTIVTHPANGAILSGITRTTVLKLARDAGYKVEERPFTLKEVFAAKELFVTGTTSFVMPIVQVDDRVIANGSPGTVALDLRARYRNYVDTVDPATAWDL